MTLLQQRSADRVDAFYRAILQGLLADGDLNLERLRTTGGEDLLQLAATLTKKALGVANKVYDQCYDAEGNWRG